MSINKDINNCAFLKKSSLLLLFLFIEMSVCLGQSNLKPIDQNYINRTISTEQTFWKFVKQYDFKDYKKQGVSISDYILWLLQMEGCSNIAYFVNDCFGWDSVATLKTYPPLSPEIENASFSQRIELVKQAYTYIIANRQQLKKKTYLKIEDLNCIHIQLIYDVVYIQRTTQNKDVDKVVDVLTSIYDRMNREEESNVQLDMVLDILRTGKSSEALAFCKGKHFKSDTFKEDDRIRKAYEKAGDTNYRKYL
ncbi:hypothetical protein QNI16_20135 [Cytophagaceae bacterium YF14B1]|uniref:Uncharacterized protein n=1 Tax=Xanthocytophaga flava TaxID=3048013 RepID=A0AAE3U7V8_9BACT|nr:hypothetical protein [Xanthocytophaga flavus]MDJ1482821.1 hypothetical protein [Xanthocytophaga flavus]